MQILPKTMKSNISRLVIFCMLWTSLPLAQYSAHASQKVLLCTALGLQWVEIKDDESNLSTTKSNPHCVFCLVNEDIESSAYQPTAERPGFQTGTLNFRHFQKFHSTPALGLALARAPPIKA